MNDKGFISIQYLFSIFLLVLIAILILSLAFNSMASEQRVENHLSVRMVLDSVSDSINQVSSNGEGYSKEITLPDRIFGSSYVLRVSKNDIVFHGGDRMARNDIMPIVLVRCGLKVDDVELYSGNSYVVKKQKDGEVSIDSRGWW